MLDLDYLKCIAYEIFNVDSPSGFTKHINKTLIDIITTLGYEATTSNKGSVVVKIKGESSEKVIATAAHTDTLGLMVRSVKGDGTLSLTNIGGPITPTLDSEYCVVYTRDDKYYTGTIVSTSPSTHVYSDANSKARSLDNLQIRIDEKVKSKADTLKLGINAGDYVFIEPKFNITDSGFIKSRFIDDKASVCAIIAVLKQMKDLGIKPAYDTFVYFTNHEEVGHGAACIDDSISEFVAVDMGCVGLDLNGNEYSVSICAKDSSGPYDYELTNKLINLAKEEKLDYIVDIFPYYGSDVSAALRGGRDIKGGLIGPGVHASHGMERTHMDALENTCKLLFKYLTTK